MEVCCAGGRKEFEVSMPVLVAGPDGKKKVWDTWNCGCGKVQFTIDEPPFCPLIDCFCDDCNRRMRIAKDKYGKNDAKKINELQPNGAYGECTTRARSLEMTKGKEHIGYFRAGVVQRDEVTGEIIPFGKWGDTSLKPKPEYRRPELGTIDKKGVTLGTINMVAKCCGAMMCHIPDAHPWGIEVNPNGLERWSREKQQAPDGHAPVIFGTYGATCGLTGVASPEGKGIKPDICGPARVKMTLGFVKIGLGVVTGNGLSWYGGAKDPLFLCPPAGAKEHNGKTIDYITDKKYLEKPK